MVTGVAARAAAFYFSGESEASSGLLAWAPANFWYPGVINLIEINEMEIYLYRQACANRGLPDSYAQEVGKDSGLHR